MIYCLVGQRGTGKSELLIRLKGYFRERILAIDIDEFIETSENTSVSGIFESKGEAYFRKLEKAKYAEVLDGTVSSAAPVVIALGAGFDLAFAKERHDVQVIWVKRVTDSSGRIFLDRPRIYPELSPLSEYEKIFKERDPRYNAFADLELAVPEGWNRPNDSEKAYFNALFFGQKFFMPEEQGILTLFPKDVSRVRHLETLGCRFEIRTDILDSQTVDHFLRNIPHGKLLYSIRTALSVTEVDKIPVSVKIDWAMELGQMPEWLIKHPAFFSVSSHEYGIREFEDYVRPVEECGKFLKYAPVVKNFPELLKGHQWAMKDSARRSFLPRNDGRWRWYRLFTRGRFPMQFISEGDSEQPDLPLILDWWRTPERAKKFAAVVGSPVLHSHTPATHWNFFQDEMKGIPVFSVDVQQSEKDEAYKVLEILGLSYAAVTSPLKDRDGANTLFFNNGVAARANTDIEGFKAAFSLLPVSDHSKVVVWGGGGTLPSLQNVLPTAQYYSARTGKNRSCPCQDPKSIVPECLIWAVPNGMHVNWPHEFWRPHIIFDLSYAENSFGREYALRSGAKYVSGLKIFEEQAKQQQLFWKKNGS